MDIRQFRYFQIAARTESLTKAAEIIHISQPALSRIIQRLEADLGFQLFSVQQTGLYSQPREWNS